ncbi:hypothetical protein BI315_15810 [Xanthomonas citri pv. citri]|nr:hypothetical protein BI314_22415 [Xanthomonas citri pv. citri]QYF43260.1 hypothetical protein HZS93_00510 [Xanthomonas citri]APR16063.1 hypothetical protein BI315_15810 [Xanthomonas citri pv. citri]APR18802.1 hypothetical protein BI316_03850 [Xanthomonas citri pv. citri]APR25164.1 hypothetical protein BJD09_14095 [Xanthomonas citri pv. citri]
MRHLIVFQRQARAAMGIAAPPNALAQRCGATPSRIEALRACLAAAANNTMHPLRLCDVRHSGKWPGAQNATHP